MDLITPVYIFIKETFTLSFPVKPKRPRNVHILLSVPLLFEGKKESKELGSISKARRLEQLRRCSVAGTSLGLTAVPGQSLHTPLHTSAQRRFPCGKI